MLKQQACVVVATSMPGEAVISGAAQSGCHTPGGRQTGLNWLHRTQTVLDADQRGKGRTSFWVAHGSAMSYFASTPHGRLPDT